MQNDPATQAWVSSLSAGDQMVLCPIVQGEILYGIERLPQGRRRTELLEKAQDLFTRVPCESLPPRAEAAYSRLKFSLYRRGFSLGENDLWIAATAIAINATLVSLDGDFGRIEGLSLVRP